MSMITFADPLDGATPNLQGYVARPPGAGPWPGVVLIHEVFGLDDNSRRHADRLADLGYLVIAPDLYTGGSRRACTRRAFADLKSGEGRTFTDLATARQWLVDQDDCTGRVGVIGFCMGGGFALLAAPEYDVCSVNYGRLPEEAKLAEACPIVGSYGRKDLSLHGAAQQLAEVLVRHDIPFDLKEYPNAGHSFLNEKPLKVPWFLVPVRKIMNVDPDPKAAADAWMRIDAFFGRFLRVG